MTPPNPPDTQWPTGTPYAVFGVVLIVVIVVDLVRRWFKRK